MNSYVRFATAAALIAFGGIIGAGAIALVPAAIERNSRHPSRGAAGECLRSANPAAMGSQLPGSHGRAAGASGRHRPA